MFSFEFCKCFKNTFYIEHLRWLLLLIKLNRILLITYCNEISFCFKSLAINRIRLPKVPLLTVFLINWKTKFKIVYLFLLQYKVDSCLIDFHFEFLMPSLIFQFHKKMENEMATFTTWTRTLDPDSEKPGSWKTWTLKNLNPEGNRWM